MNDKVVNGFISGALAYVVQGIVTLAFSALGLISIIFQDFSAILVFGYRSNNIFESIFAEFVVMIFCSLLGIIFVYILPFLKQRYFLFKGWFFGVTVWFLVVDLTKMYHIEGLTIIPFGTALVNFILASIYGLSLGFITKKFRYLLN